MLGETGGTAARGHGPVIAHPAAGGRPAALVRARVEAPMASARPRLVRIAGAGLPEGRARLAG